MFIIFIGIYLLDILTTKEEYPQFLTFSPQRRKDAKNSRFFERLFSAPLRLCGERKPVIRKMLGDEDGCLKKRRWYTGGTEVSSCYKNSLV
jgi:hypothetical protein